LGEPTEIVEESVDRGREADTVVGLVSEGLLQDTEQAFGSRDAQQHTAELSQELMPFFDLDALLVGRDRGENGEEAFNTVRRKLNREAHRIDEPPQDDVARGPIGIALP
jgi:hypothetical protein